MPSYKKNILWILFIFLQSNHRYFSRFSAYIFIETIHDEHKMDHSTIHMHLDDNEIDKDKIKWPLASSLGL